VDVESGLVAGSIQIRADVLAAIRSHAREASPHECCGLLVGTESGIDEAVRAANVLSSASRYQLDPQTHVETVRRLRGTPRHIVGAYHSHPRSPAVPSPRDRAEAHYPEFVWLIVSLETAAEECRAYRIVEGSAEELALVVDE
jgi:[CysO sulfur-carrier protein]-S-L-cysteine hydrolase